ncbi:MAG: FG-GAP repeat protein, partial [Planctomycetales bacterium]|nr:FG-GAP repeat protein [Planctomycetales bacterium]
GGIDIVHADPGYLLGDQSWGISLGDIEARATAFARLEIRGGDGEDVILGGASAETIYGGSQIDYIAGGEGDDRILGGDGDDFLFGNSLDYSKVPAAAIARVLAGTPDERPVNPPVPLAGAVAHSFLDDLASPLGDQGNGVLAGAPLPLTGSDSIDLANAFAFEGTASGASLSTFAAIGDVNADGEIDYMIGGSDDSDRYILFGPIDPSSLYRVDTGDFDTNTSVDDLRIRGTDWSFEVTMNNDTELEDATRTYRVEGQASVVASSQSDLGRLLPESADLVDEDPLDEVTGVDDLLFLSRSTTSPLFRVLIVAGQSGLQRVPESGPTTTSLTVPETIASDLSGISVETGDFTGDGAIDVLVLGNANPGSTEPIGYLFSGSDIVMGSDLDSANAAATFTVDATDRAARLAAQLPSSGNDPANYSAAVSPSLTSARAVGDVNGDGITDLLVSDSRFIDVELSGVNPTAKELRNFGRVYLLLGGSDFAANRSLDAAANYIWEGDELGAGLFEVGDLNFDGYSEFAFARGIEVRGNGARTDGAFFVLGGAKEYVAPRGV